MVNMTCIFRQYVILQLIWYDNTPGPSLVTIIFIPTGYVHIEPKITLIRPYIYIVSQNSHVFTKEPDVSPTDSGV